MTGSEAFEAEAGAPLGEAMAGTLSVHGGVCDMTVRGAELPDQLYTAAFTAVRPSVQVDRDIVTIRYPRRWPQPRGSHRASARLALNDTVPWSINVRGGIDGGRLDLSNVGLRGLRLDGGARDVEIILAYPSGTVCIDLSGGAERVVIRRPRGCGLELRVEGGVSALRFDEEDVGDASEYAARAPDAEGRAGGYRITLSGGGNAVDIGQLPVFRT